MAGSSARTNDQWVEREYIYTPGYVHEFIAQIDRYGDPLFILQDATRNVIGLADETGAIARQYTYDPYGDLIFTEMLANHAHNRIGHKGLFFDRLNGATTDRQLIPAAHGIYHNTNRAYAPHFGRYLQADPYGTGMPVLDSLAGIGESVWNGTPELSLDAMYADGMNRFAYLGAEPGLRVDPSGLFFSLAGQIGVMAIGSWMDADGALEDARTGLRTAFGLHDMLQRYAVDGIFDAAWASDWRQGDNWYAQSGVSSYAIGSARPDPSLNGVFADDAWRMGARRGANPGNKIKAKPPWAKYRQHGKDLHWRAMRDEFDRQASLDRGILHSSIRTNQVLVDASGRSVGTRLRPDVQWVGSDGKVYIIEAWSKGREKSDKAKRALYKKLLGPAFGDFYPVRGHN